MLYHAMDRDTASKKFGLPSRFDHELAPFVGVWVRGGGALFLDSFFNHAK